MRTANDIEQLGILGKVLGDMKDYLYKLEQGCARLPDAIHAEDKARPIETISQILEGLEYYLKLLQSSVFLLEIDPSDGLWKQASVSSFAANLNRTCVEICDAAEGEDYSLLCDLVEYDLFTIIGTAQELLTAVQQRFMERIEV